MKSKALGTFLRIGISLGALAGIAYFMRDHLKEAVHILQTDIVWSWFAIGVLTYFVANIFLAFRLKFVLGVQDLVLKVRDVIYLSFIGLFFNLFFPSAVGGDVAKGYYIYKHTGSKLGSTTSVILDRLLGFVVVISLGMTAVVGFSRELNDPRINAVVVIFLVVMLTTVAFFASKPLAKKFKFVFDLIPGTKWKGRIRDFYHTIHDYRRHKRALVKALFMALMGQLCFIILHYWCARALGVEINPFLFFAIVPVITIVSMAPSLGGLGVREVGSIFMFSRFMSSERAIALSLLLDIIIYGFSLLCGILFALKGGLRSKLIHEMESVNPKG